MSRNGVGGNGGCAGPGFWGGVPGVAVGCVGGSWGRTCWLGGGGGGQDGGGSYPRGGSTPQDFAQMWGHVGAPTLGPPSPMGHHRLGAGAGGWPHPSAPGEMQSVGAPRPWGGSRAHCSLCRPRNGENPPELLQKQANSCPPVLQILFPALWLPLRTCCVCPPPPPKKTSMFPPPECRVPPQVPTSPPKLLCPPMSPSKPPWPLCPQSAGSQGR